MLRIRRHRAGCAKTVKLHALGRRHRRHRQLQRVGIEMLSNFHQRVQGGVENFQAVIGNRVVFMDRELTKAGASGQALRQFEL